MELIGRVSSLDQHDKADPPTIPERYIYLLALQILEEIADSFSMIPYSNVPASAPPPHNTQEGVVDLSDETEEERPTTSAGNDQKAVMEAAWPALLAALTFLMGVNLSEDLFQELLASFKVLIIASDRIGHFTARNTFLNSLARYAVPAAVVKGMQAYSESGPSAGRNGSVLNVDALGLGAIGISSGSNQPPSLSGRNLLCLRTLLDIIRICSPTLNKSWHDLLEVLQNANYVLGKKTSSTRRPTTAGTPVIPQSPGRGRLGSFQMERAPSTMEDEVDAIQLDIRDLFGSSGTFDDDTFHHFTDALCRLSEDMVGVNTEYNSNSDAQTGASSPTRDSSSVPPSPKAMSRELHLRIPSTSRRRTSGLHMSQVTRPGEKSFAIAMLDNVASNNISRLLGNDPNLAWNNITNHLLNVAYCSLAPAVIRTQAAEVLNNILVAAANAISDPDASSATHQIEQQLFDVLSREIQPTITGAITSVDIDIRIAGLQTLQVVLESCGHALSSVWKTVFNILGSVFVEAVQVDDRESLSARRKSDLPPLDFSSLSSKSQTQMLRMAFPSVNLICSDFVLTFDAFALECAIDTLEKYGRQRLDVNITLSAIGLIWNVSDTVRSSAVDLGSQSRDALWLKLLHCLLMLATDNRNEVRTSALQTLFKCLELHGHKLPESLWSLVLSEIVFPLFDKIKQGPAALTDDELDEIEPIPFTTDDVHSQWAETAALALASLATILMDFKQSIGSMKEFGGIASRLASMSVEFFSHAGDKPCAASLTVFRKLIQLVKDCPADRSSLQETLWRAVEDMKTSLVGNAQLDRISAETPYSQDSLAILIQVAQDMHTAFTPHEQYRTEVLSNLVKEAVTYSRSPVYPADIDTMTPVQASAIDFIRASADSGFTAATPSLVLDLAEYITLAFIGAFEYVDSSLPYANSKKQVTRLVTFVALSKAAMPLAASVFTKYSKEASLYDTGAFERVMGVSYHTRLLASVLICSPGSSTAYQAPVRMSAIQQVWE